MLRFFLWMGRQSKVAQWVVILGFVFGRGLLASIARARPALAPYLVPVLALSFAFLMLTWITSPLFNLLLRFNRFGRLALSRDQRIASNWIGGCFVLAAGAFVAELVRPGGLTFVCMVYFGMLLLPLAVTFGRPPGKQRRLMAAYTARPGCHGHAALQHDTLGSRQPLAKRSSRAQALRVLCLRRGLIDLVCRLLAFPERRVMRKPRMPPLATS